MTGPATASISVQVLRGVPYVQAQARMLALLDQRVAGACPDTLLLVEPQPVFSVGRRRGAADNVLDPGDVPVVSAARGGDVTFHGPGQVVGWPIIALPPGRRDLHLWLHGLELVILAVLDELGLCGQRDARNTGVWLGAVGKALPSPARSELPRRLLDRRKVCAIGIGCRRWVTWHGFALNLNTDLGWFQRINPCGLGQDSVTRLADHLDQPPSWDQLAAACARHLDAWWQGPDPVAAVAASLLQRPPQRPGGS